MKPFSFNCQIQQEKKCPLSNEYASDISLKIIKCIYKSLHAIILINDSIIILC